MLRHVSRVARQWISLLVLAGSVGCADHGPDRTPAKVTIGPPVHTEVMSGAELTLSASVTNAAGEALTGNTIEWRSTDATIAAVGPTGVVKGIRVGQAQIIATVGTIQSLPITLTVTPGVAAKLAIRTQPTGAASGIPFTTQPVIEIHDAAGNLVTSSTETVTAIIATGGGTVTGSTATAVGGVATFTSLTISGSVGDRTMLFAVGGLTAVTSNGFAVGPGAPARLVIRTQPTGAPSGALLGTQPVVEIRDDAGNLTTSAAAITATIASGQGVLNGSSAAAVAGVATFTNLSITGLVGSYTLSFNSAGLTSITSSTFTLAVGQAAALRVRNQPAGAIVGVALSTQPTIEVTDGGGNLVATSGVVVTATIASGGGSLIAPTATTADGVATFAGLGVIGPVGPHTIAFSATGLSSVTSAAFQLGSGLPTQLVLRAQPTTAVNGVFMSPAPVVAAVDAAGNQTNYSGTVTASIASGLGTLYSGPATMISGSATLSSLIIIGPVGSVTLRFQSSGLGTVTSAPIAVTAGAAARLVVTTLPPAFVTSGVPMSPQPVVEILDVGGNRVSGTAVVTLTTDAITGTISNGSATAVNGIATFAGLTLSGPPGGRDYWFVGAGLLAGNLRITIQ